MILDPRQVKEPRKEPEASPLHRPALHESGLLHATGEARYVDDLPEPRGMLHGLVLASPHAHARIVSTELERARAVPGVHAVLSAADIPGENLVGPVIHDEPLLAEDEVHCVGQSVAVIFAESPAIARRAAELIEVGYQELPAILGIEAAEAEGAWLSDPHVIARGEVEAALAAAPHRFEGELRSGAQDHFYLETQVALVIPEEAGAFRVFSSTQHPSEVQAVVAEVLGLGRHQVIVECPRMGGGFGGKETQAAPFAALAALGARVTGRPCKVWLNRDQDMAQTGKRHPFRSRYRAGFSADGRILALDVQVVSDGGFSNDLSRSILDRALFHLDNCYWLPAVRLEGRVARTNLPSNTAFRGFGGPQGMLVIEAVLDRAASLLAIDPAVLRERNFYAAGRGTTPYGQAVELDRLPRLWSELIASSDYFARRAAIESHNASSPWLKRGIAFQPVKFGISFTASFLNQAGALVSVFADGSVQLNHGGTEMGQGLHTKMLAVAAHALGLPVERIRAMVTATDKVPNTSATAASSGSDLNGQAVKLACETIKERLRPIAAMMLRASDPRALRFAGGRVWFEGRAVDFAEVASAAHLARVSLSSTGYYATPDIGYDRAAGRGTPFYYFAYGAAVSEVELSGLTGEHRLSRVDILQDCGDSLVPTIDRGQVEGGFIQGYGWLTGEEVLFDPRGRLLTHSPDTYKIPAIGDAPPDFRVRLLERAAEGKVIHGSKAVGEPPLMLAISALSALRHAIGSWGPRFELAIPATPEALLRAIEAATLSR